MSHLRELLKQRRLEINEEIKTLKDEINEIKSVMAMLDAGENAPAPKKKLRRDGPNTRAAILEAIKNGAGKPTEIMNHIHKHHEFDVTTAAISTALTTMKNNGEVERDKHTRWQIPKKETMNEIGKKLADANESLTTGPSQETPTETVSAKAVKMALKTAN